METVEATFRIVTPMFIGGAEPDIRAELREPSIKGALRFWYRAIDPDYKENESRIFGGNEKSEGQSIFLLRVAKNDGGPRNESNSWNPDQNLNGLKYFSLALQGMGGSPRHYLEEGENVLLSLIFRQIPDISDRRRIITALWLLGHMGGLGSRSRRGFGTLALESWKALAQGDWAAELEGLPIAHGQTSIAEWQNKFRQALIVFKRWFPCSCIADHTVFGPNTKFKLFINGKSDWANALNDAGLAMQKFRQRRDLSNVNSDYYRVKKHIVQHDSKAAGTPVDTSVGKALLTEKGPDRAAFGLPLKFQYSSLKYYTHTDSNGRKKYKTPDTTFQGQDHDRSASRIHVRIVKIGENYHPMYIRLDGPLLCNEERVKDIWGNYEIPTDSILDLFWSSLSNTQEVFW